MGSTYLTIHVDPELDRGIRSVLQAFAHIRLDRSSIQIYDLVSSDWRQVFSILIRRGYRVSSAGGFTFLDYDYGTFRPNFGGPCMWVGAVLVPSDSVSSINSVEDFSDAGSPPCNGQLRRDKPLRLDRNPTSLVCGVGEELIYSTRFINALGLYDHGVLGSVEIGGTESSNWKRIFFDATTCTVAKECALPTRMCALCSQPYIPELGIWIAHTENRISSDIAVDEIGIGHQPFGHPVIVSREFAMEIQKCFPHSDDYELLPIHLRGSATAEEVLECRAKLVTMF